MKNGWYYAWTPGGTFLPQTGGKTEKECITRLMRDAAHMPYRTWEDFKRRGYTVEKLEVKLNEH